ncbi:MAG: autotransporter adhesin family protein, partial [Oscillospiraceae bacterium]|nr:autotransporter adhesin family protein [Oscillospiraceae bacterium]
MRKFAFFFTFLAFLCVTCVTPVPARADTAAQLAAQIGAIPGLAADIDAADQNVLIVSNSFTSATTTLTLNIDPDVTVKWGAVYRGNIQSTGKWENGSTVVLTGNGTFEVVTGAWLENEGTGNAIYARGDDAKVIVSGSGVVEADSGSAIEMNGLRATVVVCGSGAVMNNATTNLHPAINMSNENNTALNVKVTDNGSVTALNPEGGAGTSPGGYAIQTRGDVAISGNAHVSTYSTRRGRAINALGANSQVTVSDSAEVRADNGIAISAGKSVNVSGGLVCNSSESATYPVIEIRAGSGLNVVIEGTGKVDAKTNGGTAIKTTGDVEIKDSAVVSATTGKAVNAEKGSVTVSGGFVFAYGTLITDVVQSSSFNTVDNGIVVAWNSRRPGQPYTSGGSNDIFLRPDTGDATAVWRKVGGLYGISYASGANIGFYPLPVEILPSPGDVSDQGLFFNVADGRFYKNGSLIPEALYGEVNDRKGTAWDWDGASKTLSLTDFVWHGDAAKNVSVALTIVNGISNDAGSLTVELNGVSIFGVITNEARVPGNSYAIYAERVSLTITGDGKLSAVAGKTTGSGNNSIGIYAPSLTMEGGILYATGNGPAGGDSIGLSAAASLTVNGGMLYATGGGKDGPVAGNSIGINTPSLTVNGGMMESIGYDSALNSSPIMLPESYTYWTNDEPKAPEKIITSQLLTGTGTLYYDGPGSGEPYGWEQSQKY